MELAADYRVDPLYLDVVALGHERRDECFLIKSPKPDKMGYVRICRKVDGEKKSVSVHRIVYRQWNGEIPAGYHVDHTCHNEASHRGECDGGNSCWHRRCINPAHLRAVTHQENLAASPRTSRGHEPRGVCARNAEVTHCPQGHAYDEANTRYKAHNKHRTLVRDCRTCDRERQAAKRADRIAAQGGPKPRKRKEICKHGHAMTPGNTIIEDNLRICRSCYRAMLERRYERQRVERAAKRAAKGVQI